MVQVKSPYNFVPAPDSEGLVYHPAWSVKVSHDIPFSDGLSGEIRFTIEAKTPVFIRNGTSELMDEKETDFSHVVVDGKKRFFIPATSLKGMTRNVLEILSRSRMRFINDHRHSVRQIMRPNSEEKIDEGYGLIDQDEQKKIYAGYLKWEEGRWFIYPCGKPFKIHYKELDEFFNLGENSFERNFARNDSRAKIGSKFENRTASYKYKNILKGKTLESTFKKDEKRSHRILEYVKFSDSDGFEGRIVCTGQAMAYSVKQARRGEYVFRGRREDVVSDKNKRLEVREEVWQAFKLTTRIGEHDESPDWKFWQKEREKGIPVFFRHDDVDKNKVKDFGLTFMYKEPVKFSVRELLQYDCWGKGDNYQPDLAETIFGYLDEANEGNSLKGRVFFSHAFALGDPPQLEEHSAVLASPKSSYYPFYLKQNGDCKKAVRRYRTYNDSPALRGFKRYPVREDFIKQDTTGMSQDIISRFRPLAAGARFAGCIRFHNLKKAELGALLSALTFHGDNGEQYFHSLGGGKPFGYGRIQLKVDKVRLYDCEEDDYLQFDDFLSAFECEMKTFDPDWNHRDWLKELFAMAKPHPSSDQVLGYMALDDFKEVKKEGKFLCDYSKLVDNDGQEINEFCSDSEDYIRGQKEVEKKFVAETQKAIKRLADPDLRKADEQIRKGELESALNFLKALREKFGDLPDILDLIKKCLVEDVKNKLALHDDRGRLEATVKPLLMANPEYELVRDKLPALIDQRLHELRLRVEEERKKKVQEPLVFDDFSFESVKNIVKKRYESLGLGKGDSLPEDDIQKVEEAVRKSFEEESGRGKKSKFHKKGKPCSFNKFPWTDIQRWLGKDRAKALYHELIED
ncbi:MAG: TIGR03986 family CRISPR-associated RAMP protein [Methanobacteriota archaeon]|nr:MAG: TIGR03986 family CRISPR-associated RAMP protein [Euryarchaeota archaeon]